MRASAIRYRSDLLFSFPKIDRLDPAIKGGRREASAGAGRLAERGAPSGGWDYQRLNQIILSDPGKRRARPCIAGRGSFLAWGRLVGGWVRRSCRGGLRPPPAIIGQFGPSQEQNRSEFVHQAGDDTICF